MEKRLQDFVLAVGITSDIANLDSTAPQVIYKNNPSIAKTSTFVIGKNEPHDMVLPLNVVWLDWNPNSPTYRHAKVRESKDADPSGTYVHTWRTLYFYDEIWTDQAYDQEDSDAISNGEAPGPATITELGLVRLATAWTGQGYPAVLVEGDPRLSDPRVPKDHTHPEKPATSLAHDSGAVVTITSGTPEAGAVLMATSSTSAGWAKIREEDLQS